MHITPSLLWTLEEIGQLVSGSGNPSETLTNIVNLIQQRFVTDVCSVYLLEPDRTTLVLAATIGLRPESVGLVKMRVNEGLAGLVAEQLRPVFVRDATQHPRFKYFREAGEDPYRTFVGVPVIDRGVLQGVLVVQTAESRAFSDDDLRMLATAGAQLAPIVSEARAVGNFVTPVHQRLLALAQNLWWSWDEESVSLFRELDPVRWRECDHNPIQLLQEMPIAQLEARASQLALHGRINYAYRRLREYLQSKNTWGGENASVLGARPVAYFSAEFGLHESLPIYSGGLGILAGDHLKSASDLGIPLVGIGLYYDQGYFRQRLDIDGWQHEDYLDVDSAVLPIQPATARDGSPLTVEIETRTGRILARVWRVSVGRNTLLLLDSNVDGNSPEDRQLTSRLYGGDERVRIRQELVLGVGGARALAALDLSPGVVHLNEGHSAFAALELIRRRMASEGVDVAEASRRVAAHVVFTTHTPVPAGHDRFAPALIEEHLGPLRDALGLSYDDLMAFGRVNPHDHDEQFCMTVLALKASRRANAVSSLHGHVSREMWMPLHPGLREDQVPIGHITNGVHVSSWLAPQMRQVYERHLGADWTTRSTQPDLWRAIENVDDGELWETHQTLKARLIDFTRRRAVQQAERRGEPAAVVSQLRRALNLDALTIGFARRFATYKRANLMLQDLEALARLVNHRADAGAGHLRRQGPPARRARQDRAAADLRAHARPGVSRQAGVHRGLRHQRRPPPGPGRRRLAEQPAAPAGGVRHERPEGRAQRCAQSLGARWLVGRGVRRAQRLRHRPGRNPHVARRPRRTRRAGPRDGAARRGRASLLRPRPRRPAAGVDRADETRHPHARRPLQRRPHGDGLRAQLLHPGSGRHEL